MNVNSKNINKIGLA